MNDLGVWLAENVMGYVRGSHCGVSGWHSRSGKLFICDGNWDPWIYGEQAESVLNAMLERGWKCEVGKNSQVTFAKGDLRATNDHNCSYELALGYAAKAAIEAERAQEKKRHTCRKRLDVEAYHMFDVWWRHMSNGCWDRVSNDECPFCGEELAAKAAIEAERAQESQHMCPLCGE